MNYMLLTETNKFPCEMLVITSLRIPIISWNLYLRLYDNYFFLLITANNDLGKKGSVP